MNTSALLCEQCGYTIDHLPRTGNCPECGEAIGKSLPSVRTGSPFQVSRRLFPWFRTNWLALRHPRTLFRNLRIEPRTGNRLLIVNLLIAGMFVVDPWVSVFNIDPSRANRNGPFLIWAATYGAMWMVEVGLGALLLFALTRLEWYGMRFIAERRGWRLTRDAAWQVCCHASVGWIFVGLVPLLGMAWIYIFANWFGLSAHGMLRLPGILRNPVPWSEVVNFGVIGLGFLAGMLVFETLVYLGVRQCRFGNAVDTPLEQPPTAISSAPGAVHSEGQPG